MMERSGYEKIIFILSKALDRSIIQLLQNFFYQIFFLVLNKWQESLLWTEASPIPTEIRWKIISYVTTYLFLHQFFEDFYIAR